MAKRVLLPLVLVAAGVGAGLYVANLRSQITALQKPPAAAPTAPSGPRTLSDDQKQAMLGVLRTDGGEKRKIWFQVELGRAEPAAFQKSLESVFREAGWDVDTKGAAGMTFKPGIYILVGEEEWPSDASTAYQAFQIAGIDVKAGSGYREYYDQQKKEKPGWTGPKLADDQAYVVLVGANPGA